MAFDNSVSDSEDSEIDLLRTPSKKDGSRELSQTSSALSHRFRDSPSKLSEDPTQESISSQADTIAVMVPAVMVSGPLRPWEYKAFQESTTVDTVLEELELPGEKLFYKIEYEDGRQEDVSVYPLFGCKSLSLQIPIDYFCYRWHAA